MVETGQPQEAEVKPHQISRTSRECWCRRWPASWTWWRRSCVSKSWPLPCPLVYRASELWAAGASAWPEHLCEMRGRKRREEMVTLGCPSIPTHGWPGRVCGLSAMTGTGPVCLKGLRYGFLFWYKLLNFHFDLHFSHGSSPVCILSVYICVCICMYVCSLIIVMASSLANCKIHIHI